MRFGGALLGIGVGLFLHLVVGWWMPVGFAQGGNGITLTSSASSSIRFASPPDCSPVGTSETVATPTVETIIGPGCAVTGNRDVANPSSCSTGPGALTGTPFTVVTGTTNFNTNTHTETIQCVAAVPVVPWPTLLGLSGALAGLGAWTLRRRRN